MTELEVQIHTLPPMCVAVAQAVGPSPEQAAWGKLAAWAKLADLQRKESREERQRALRLAFPGAHFSQKPIGLPRFVPVLRSLIPTAGLTAAGGQ